ncbi:hypothetical protein [Thermoflexibacter ruber]|uniref:Uncharacterized protein n=1 Tax=Thermoflexibacter ruber TaxID=1003 RepID=A0A1I2JGQ3_9BACT|nr:hypothetical protein [Thermoflexibacter ruber]SFF53258.1 hypothetical protein SAMN04488541_105010 [Thermoflexibacter ruber]
MHSQEKIIVDKLVQSSKLKEVLDDLFASNHFQEIISSEDKLVVSLKELMLKYGEIIKQEFKEVKKGEKNIEETFIYQKMMPLNPLKIEEINYKSKEDLFAELLPEVPEIKDLDAATFSRLTGEASKKLIAEIFGFKL